MKLKSISTDKPLAAWPPLIAKVRSERRDAERIERQKMNGPAGFSRACRNAGMTEADVEALDKRLQTLPADGPEFKPALQFVADIVEKARSLPGNLEPPISHLLHRDLYPIVGMSCLNLNCSLLALVAVGWLRATRQFPQAFAEGCDDPDVHAALIQKLAVQEQELMAQAARAVTLEDLSFEFLPDIGTARVTYAMTNGKVPASAPDDPRGIGALVTWWEQQQDHPDEQQADENEVVPGQVRRV